MNIPLVTRSIPLYKNMYVPYILKSTQKGDRPQRECMLNMYEQKWCVFVIHLLKCKSNIVMQKASVIYFCYNNILEQINNLFSA